MVHGMAVVWISIESLPFDATTGVILRLKATLLRRSFRAA